MGLTAGARVVRTMQRTDSHRPQDDIPSFFGRVHLRDTDLKAIICLTRSVSILTRSVRVCWIWELLIGKRIN